MLLESDKYKMLTDLYGLLNIGQSIIFVHVSRLAPRSLTVPAWLFRLRLRLYLAMRAHAQPIPLNPRIHG